LTYPQIAVQGSYILSIQCLDWPQRLYQNTTKYWIRN